MRSSPAVTSFAAIAVLTLIASQSRGDLTISSVSRAVNGSSFVFAPPDSPHYGDSFSVSNSTLGAWGGGTPYGFSAAGNVGFGSAGLIFFQSSNITTSRFTLQGRSNINASSSGNCAGDSVGDWTCFVRFTITTPTRAIFFGGIANFDGGTYLLTCGLVGAAPVVSTGTSHSLDIVLSPGTYDYRVQSHASAHCSGSCDIHSDIGVDLDVQFFPLPCPSDFNHDDVTYFFDYLDFVDALSSSEPSADFNHDNVIDFFDYLDFVDAFSTGC